MKDLADSLPEELRRVPTAQRVAQMEIIRMTAIQAGRRASIPLVEVEMKTG